jgi:hypothetical protein
MSVLYSTEASAQIVGQLGTGGPSNFTILSLGGADSQIRFSGTGTVQGNIGIANSGLYDSSGNAMLTGSLYLGSEATGQTSGRAQVQGGIQQAQDALLTPSAAAVIDASAAFAQMAATLSLPGNEVNLTGSQTLTINGVAGTNVLNLKGIVMSGGAKLILSAPGQAQFIINNAGPFQISGGASILLNRGLTAYDVVFNNLSPSVQLYGNSAGSGILLAIQSAIQLQGTWYGEVIGGRGTNITIAGNANVIGPPTNGQISAALNAQALAASLFQSGIDPSGGLSSVRNLPGVLATGVSPDGSTIWIDYVGGIEGLISLFPSNTLGGRHSRSARQVITKPLHAMFAPQQVQSAGSLTFPGNSNYLGLYPFADSTDASSAPIIQGLVSATCAGPNFSSLMNQQVTVDTFTQLGSYGIINVFTHGAQDKFGEPVIATRELSTVVTNRLHLLDLTPDSTGHRSLILWNPAGSTYPYFALTPLFFYRHYAPGSLSRAAFFINSCDSLASNDLSDALISAGAGVYLGWTSGTGLGVGTTFANNTMESLFTALTQRVDPSLRTIQIGLGQISTVFPVSGSQLQATGSAANTAICSPFLTLQKAGPGTGSVISNPSGVDCGSSCTTAASPFYGPVALTAVPDQGSTFAGWSGDCSGANPSTAVQVTAGKTSCTATFTKASPAVTIGATCVPIQGEYTINFSGSALLPPSVSDGTSYSAISVYVSGVPPTLYTREGLSCTPSATKSSFGCFNPSTQAQAISWVGGPLGSPIQLGPFQLTFTAVVTNLEPIYTFDLVGLAHTSVTVSCGM